MPLKYTKPRTTAIIAATTDIIIGALVCRPPSVVPASEPEGTSGTVVVAIMVVTPASGIVVTAADFSPTIAKTDNPGESASYSTSSLLSLKIIVVNFCHALLLNLERSTSVGRNPLSFSHCFVTLNFIVALLILLSLRFSWVISIY